MVASALSILHRMARQERERRGRRDKVRNGNLYNNVRTPRKPPRGQNRPARPSKTTSLGPLVATEPDKGPTFENLRPPPGRHLLKLTAKPPKDPERWPPDPDEVMV